MNKKQLTQRWYKANRENAIEYQRKWRQANPESMKSKQLKSKYGITLDQYNVMCKKQNNACALCFRVRKLCVDHNHKTDQVRKLLCISCNSRLGWFEPRKLQILKYIK